VIKSKGGGARDPPYLLKEEIGKEAFISLWGSEKREDLQELLNA